MPSSTSSSDAAGRLPRGSGARTILLAALLFAALAAGSEIYWRAQGHLTQVADTISLWSYHRARMSRAGAGGRVVVLGTSRAQVGIVPKVLGEGLGRPAVAQLAIDGTSPYQVLLDLANDETFSGIVLCSAAVDKLLPTPPEGRDHEYADFYRLQYHAWRNVNTRWNRVMEAWLQDRLVIVSPHMTIRDLIHAHGRPVPSYQSMRFDRHRCVWYRERLTPEALRKHYRTRPTPPGREKFAPTAREAVREQLAYLTDVRRKILAKGGQLVLVRMPSRSGRVDDSMSPKSMYWDHLTEWTGVPTIHFLDEPSLNAFECPDGSHLDAADAPEFTRRLAVVIRRVLSNDK